MSWREDLGERTHREENVFLHILNAFLLKILICLISDLLWNVMRRSCTHIGRRGHHSRNITRIYEDYYTYSGRVRRDFLMTTAQISVTCSQTLKENTKKFTTMKWKWNSFINESWQIFVFFYFSATMCAIK